LAATLFLPGCAAMTPAPRFSPTSPADRDAPESPPRPIPPLSPGAAAPAEKPARSEGIGHESHQAPVAPAQPEGVAEVYVCSMHDDVRQPSPGACRKCGMPLVPSGKPRGQS
jgi:hypothetical protein